MLNCSASLAMSTSVLKALPGKLDIKRHSPSILYILLLLHSAFMLCVVKMQLKGEVGGSALNSLENCINDHGKSWNCDFEFMWESNNKRLYIKPKSVAAYVGVTFQLLQKLYLSRDMRFPSMWYVRPAKPQISLRICTV